MPKHASEVANEITAQTFAVTAGDFEKKGGLIMAENSFGKTALLGYRVKGDSGDSELSIRSTAISIVLMITGSALEADDKRILIDIIESHQDFSSLAASFTRAFLADHYFLENIGNDEELVAQIKTFSSEVLLSFEAAKSRTSKAATSINYYENERWGETWKWWLYNNGIATFDPPFMATTDDGDKVAVANPTMVNYIARLYNASGEEIDWYMVPRNSTLIQKTGVNGWAVKRELAIDSEIGPSAVHIAFERNALVNGLNTFHLFSGIIGVVSDATPLIKISKLVEISDKLGIIVDLGSCLISLSSTVDFTTSETDGFIKKFLNSNALSASETLITGCMFPLVSDIADIVIDDVSKDLAKSTAKILAKASNAVGWAVMVFDLNNDLAPFVLSWIQSDDYIGFDLQWTSSSQALINVMHNDDLPVTTEQCDSSHLELCDTQEACVFADGHWHSNDTCQNYPEVVNECSYANLGLCDTLESCELAGGHWHSNDTCQNYPEVVCSSTNLSLCDTQEYCVLAGGYWYNDTCNIAPEAICDAQHLNLCVSEGECNLAAGYWYDSTCNSTPEPTQVGTVTSAGQVWMDRNLGASRVATSSRDTEAYGDLYQWGRGTDGHEKRNSGYTSIKATSDTPGHSLFITASGTPYDWRTPQNNNLWQGISGINNPCPSGFRLPTATELEIERASWNRDNSAGAVGSPTKLVVAGSRQHFSGATIGLVGINGMYWSSTDFSGTYNHYLSFSSNHTELARTSRAHGHSVRCLKD